MEVSGPKILFQQFQYSGARMYFDDIQALLPSIAQLLIILKFKDPQIPKHSIHRVLEYELRFA